MEGNDETYRNHLLVDHDHHFVLPEYARINAYYPFVSDNTAFVRFDFMYALDVKQPEPF